MKLDAALRVLEAVLFLSDEESAATVLFDIVVMDDVDEHVEKVRRGVAIPSSLLRVRSDLSLMRRAGEESDSKLATVERGVDVLDGDTSGPACFCRCLSILVLLQFITPGLLAADACRMDNGICNELG